MSDKNFTRSTALFGCGRWGRNIGRTLSDLGALKVIVDPSEVLVRPLSAEWGADFSTDPAFALASPDIDSVAIAVPAADHAELAIAALKAGKHVFVEKPLALTVADARACEEASRSSRRVLMVGHLLQYHPAFIRLVELVEDGAIGELRHVVSNRLNPGAVRTEENALWSFAPHDFSMILRLFGAAPVAVSSLAARLINPAIPDQFAVLMRFDQQATAQVNISWIAPQKEHKLTVLGTTGALVLEDTATDPDRKLVLFRNYIDLAGSTPKFVKSEGEPVAFSNEQPLRHEMRSFLEAIRGSDTNRTDASEAIRVLELLQRASADGEQI